MSGIFSFFIALAILLILFSQPHPLFFALGLLGFSLLVSLTLMSQVNLWLGLSLCLIFMGGMMVIILYVSALASEYKFSIYSTGGALAFLALLAPTLFSMEKTSLISPVISALYFHYSSFSMILLLAYLLLTLIIVVLVSESYQGPVSSWN